MKNKTLISRILATFLLSITLLSCETTDLNLIDDPNNITVPQGDLEFLMNSVQLNFADFMRQIGDNGSEVVRIENMRGGLYVNAYSPTNLNEVWSTAYAGMFSDMAIAEGIALENGNTIHLGVINTLKAYSLMTLVDHFGDVPYSQISQPDLYPSPIADSGSEVYAVSIDLLNQAMVYFNTEGGRDLDIDVFYHNDVDKWKKLVNTIKMINYLNTRLVDSDAINKFNAIASNPSLYISSNEDDFVYNYAINSADPDTRHPGYAADYVPGGGAGSYRSVWFMNELRSSNDPRLQFYFKRQTACTPGAGCDGDQVTLPCSVRTRPDHYPSTMVYCNIASGYWGRDHGNDEGIPPDTFLRSVVGLYPYGGEFDSGTGSVESGDGAGGAGIVPLLLTSWVNFMKAEVALQSGDLSSANLQEGMTNAINKVYSFIPLDPGATIEDAPSETAVSNYITNIVTAYDNGDTETKWNILAKQLFVSNYGNGNGAYNFYRRTGFPNDLQFNLEPNTGAFIRSFKYPANEANVNSNISQKPNVTEKVFWDTNPDGPSFPFSN